MSCYHCGQEFENKKVEFDGNLFCCLGCKTVYEILNEKDLSNYYEMNSAPGSKPELSYVQEFEYLDDPKIFQKIVDYTDEGISIVQFLVPVIHCTSCVWLLEDLNQLNPNIQQSKVNFTQRTVQIYFNHNLLSLSNLAKFMTRLGYKPSIQLDQTKENRKQSTKNHKLISQLVVAGFCFGNIMLLSFPEYIDNEEPWLEQNKNFFRWTMFLLSLPVLFYSSQSYFSSAWQGIKHKYSNIDIPIALGILALFLRSFYDIVFDVSPGYFDSLCGLVFFMLIGKWVQQKTYSSLSFDRDYKSFYPIAVTKIQNQEEKVEFIENLEIGDRILVRNQEMIPADSVLIRGKASLDNSFITGESHRIKKVVGDKIFAGGKQIGAAIELELVKKVNQSHLTSLWNHGAFTQKETQLASMIQTFSKYFTIAVLLISFFASIFWYFYDASQVLFVFTAILIVACPCALALSSPFIFGNVMGVFGRNQLYLRDSSVIEQLGQINHCVFDKTGTLTNSNHIQKTFVGKVLSEEEQIWIKSTVKNSLHPLSQSIYNSIKTSTQEIENFQEIRGKGIQSMAKGNFIKIGSLEFVQNQKKFDENNTEAHISINEVYKGKFVFKTSYRRGVKQLLRQLNLPISVISGDQSSEKNRLNELFSHQAKLLFNQKPEDKLQYIESLQKEASRVLMLGDGLNDSGALKVSDVGISITENLNNFSPSSDAILHANSFDKLWIFMQISQKSIRLVWVAFAISLLYNIIGLIFAITGNLQPVVAAILMPISSISVVLFATFSTKILAWRFGV